MRRKSTFSRSGGGALRKALGIVAVAAAAAASTTAPVHATATSPENELVQYRVHDAASKGNQLDAAGFDVIRRSGSDMVVVGSRNTGDELHHAGYTSDVERTYPAVPMPQQRTADGTYYGGYHTVDAHYQNMTNAQTNHPDLAKVITYGQSWRKQQGKGGHDLEAICITKINAGDCAMTPEAKKPRFLLQTQIHAREIATGEMAYKWINHLVDNYGKDPQVTALMDSTELWVVPMVNPDGVDLVSAGGNTPVMHRKNADYTDAQQRLCGDTTSSQAGVDLNRNFNYHWQLNAGQCDQTTSSSNGKADSEPETVALEKLWLDLFGDHRADDDTSKADAGARGTALMLHSYASIVILPWEYTHARHTPDDASLRATAKQLGAYNGYAYGQAGEILYDAAGGSDDTAYGRYGISSFTIELGDETGACDGFAPAYSCVDSKFWPGMVQSFQYLGEKAPHPYTNS